MPGGTILGHNSVVPAVAAVWLMVLGEGVLSRLNKYIDAFEEGFIALILAVMTLVTFWQVVMRYGFTSGWGGALQFTRILFAWLILFGMSYGLKIGSHLGVDAFIRLFPKPIFRAFGLVGALLTLLYAALLFDADWFGGLLGLDNRGSSGGAFDYVTKYYKLSRIGMEDLKFPVWYQEMFDTQERVPRWWGYVIMPIGLGLLAFRSLQMCWLILTGQRDTMIAAHEAEDLVEENKDVLKD